MTSTFSMKSFLEVKVTACDILAMNVKRYSRKQKNIKDARKGLGFDSVTLHFLNIFSRPVSCFFILLLHYTPYSCCINAGSEIVEYIVPPMAS